MIGPLLRKAIEGQATPSEKDALVKAVDELERNQAVMRGWIALGGRLNIHAADIEVLNVATALVLGSGGTVTAAGLQVVGQRVIDERADDVANSGDATTDGLIDALRDAMVAHGLIAAA
jgi:hypothetical protein